jgi:transcriptional regulator with XRE-family HTH domain
VALSDRILEARKQHLSMTQSELAAQLGVEAVTVSRWERGVVEPRPGVIRQLSRLTGLSVGWFFSENGEAAA